MLYGNVGTGKTHLATDIGVEACKMGLNVHFFPLLCVLVLSKTRYTFLLGLRSNRCSMKLCISSLYEFWQL
ncbi:ATP-binding protein [Thermotalea metallivorans]|uniref:ATP-binding protein n=1 Tax=Thermotalea metallivorans TaxID=520762 RepID=UPI00241D9FB4|nr:ATP-binding protein [Thermotalea metallivorans]